MQELENNVQLYYPLGQKTFFMLILNRSFLLGVLFVCLIALLISFSYVPYAYVNLATQIIFGYLLLFIIVAGLTFVAGWLEYIHYSIEIDEKVLKVKKGFIAEETTGIPYRRIKDVRIKRSLIHQMLGVSNIVIVLLSDENESSQRESVTFLPVLEKEIALHIQDSILKKAQVEQIDVLSGHENVLNRPK